MELIELVMLMMGGVLISSLLEPLLPRVSLPLVQIAIGIVFALFVPLSSALDLNTDLFLVLFIAPLLFDESRNADNRALWTNKGSVASLAIGLVIATALAIGFTLHALVASIPLTAAFAVGAALGPTDAVAVASLGKDVALSTRQKAQLSGEALLNDASGVVSFEFAIAATTTGAFSIVEASQAFAVEFAGGVLLGLALGAAYVAFSRRYRKSGLDSVTVHVLFEVCMPFFVYLAACFVHVSGIIAVVAAGLFITFSPIDEVLRSSSDSHAETTRLSIVSDSVWEVLSFVLNGIIFLMMGMLLPQLTEPVLSGIDVTSLRFLWLVGIVAAVTVAMHGLRFLWILCMDFLSANEETGGRGRFGAELARKALVTTLAGAKGAVAVAIAFTMPVVLSDGSAFPQRSLLMFIVCGVSIVSLLIANFVVPVLAPSEDDDAPEVDPDIHVKMLASVVEQLRDKKTDRNAQAVSAVVRTYQKRIAHIRRENASDKHLKQLRFEVLQKQDTFIREAVRTDSVDLRTGNDYLRRIEKLVKRLERYKGDRAANTQSLTPLASSTGTFERVANNITPQHHVSSTLEFKIDLETVAVQHLEGAARSSDELRADAAQALLIEHRSLLSALKQRKRTLDQETGTQPDAHDVPDASAAAIERTQTGKLKKVRPANPPETLLSDVYAEALRLELDQIQTMRRKGKISNAAARDMRQDVYLNQMGLSDA